jgi:Tol biopolymer transport system component
VPASGGAPETLTTVARDAGEIFHQWPQVLPRGRILFHVEAKPEIAGTYVISRQNPKERRRVLAATGHSTYAAGHLLWLRGSALVAQPFDPERLTLSGDPVRIADPVGVGGYNRATMAVSSAGLLVHGRGGIQLTWVDRAGKADGPLLGEPGDYRSFRPSPDGRRVVLSRASPSGRDLWTVDVERNAWSRMTFLTGVAQFPVWSPDGRYVIFQTGSPFSIYRKEVTGAGGEEPVIPASGRNLWPNDWSKDGRMLLYYEQAKDTQRDLWVLPVKPNGQPDGAARPYLRTRFNEFLGRFSPEPNPRWVAYRSDESGTSEIYVQAFPEPRGKVQISTGGGLYLDWSPDGRHLYYLSTDSRLMAVDLKQGADTLVPSAPRELFPVAMSTTFQPFAVSPDGRRFLVQVPVGGSQPLEVIVNWPALLKKGAPVE